MKNIFTILAFISGILCVSCGPTPKYYQTNVLSETNAAATQAATAVHESSAALKDVPKQIKQDTNQVRKTPNLPEVCLPPLNDIDQQADKVDAVTKKLETAETKINSLIVGLDQLKTQVQQLVEQNAKLASDNVQLKVDAQKAKDEWNTSWFGGKMWRLLFVVVGTIVALLIADFLLVAFAGPAFAFLNPITLIMNLTKGAFSMFTNAIAHKTALKVAALPPIK